MFLDTSGLFALHDASDRHHRRARELFNAAPRLLTHNYVFAELVALGNARKVPREPLLRYLDDLQAYPLIEVRWVDEVLHAAAMTLLHRRLDKGYSLCDAVSFLEMEATGVREALTTDHHFEQEGFVRLLCPP